MEDGVSEVIVGTFFFIDWRLVILCVRFIQIISRLALGRMNRTTKSEFWLPTDTHYVAFFNLP